MKTLSESIREKLTIANEATVKASKYIKAANESQKRLRKLLTIVFLLVTVAINAQSFEKINGLGKSQNEVMSLTNPNFIRFSVGEYDEMICINRYSTDFGIIGYVFNEKNICVKVLIPTVSKRSYDLTGYKTMQVKGNVTEVE